MHNFRVEIQIHANIVAVLHITGHFPASQRLEEHIRKYVKDHNANVDGKIKAAEDRDEDAFLNDSPGGMEAQSLQNHIHKYVDDHSEYIDTKIENAEDENAGAFFNDNPGFRPLSDEIDRLQGLQLD
ncbi:hypothetical protein LTR56_002207 [Elasticomyces elasticus]|nr:hypothetical protein LTR56_002207 [Elasticomyces elasticus]KAK3666087.1 hypothetical protein LTR22_003090 [Elasticomyces elasticus]